VTDRSQLRLVVLGVLVVSLVATLLGRLWYLQVLNGSDYTKLLNQTEVRQVVTLPVRGEIVDDLGRPLVDNKPALVVSVNRMTLDQQPDGGKKVLMRLSKLLHKPYALLNHETMECGLASNGKTIGSPCWAYSPYQPIPVSQAKPDVADEKVALQIQTVSNEFPGVTVQLAAVRHYPRPDGANASTILGYTSLISDAALKKLSPEQQAIERGATVGALGLEESYNKYLAGTPGVRRFSVDNAGTVVGNRSNTTAVPGDDIVTNLDAQAQATLEKELHSAILSARGQGYTANYSAGVVLNVKTGGVIAMAGSPSYPVNKPPSTLTNAEYKTEVHEGGNLFFDKAYQGQAAPGSTFKLISASGLLADGTTTTSAETSCPPEIYNKKNFEGESYPLGTLHEAIVKSCDTVFYQLANADWNRDNSRIKNKQKPIEGVQKMARAYGLGSPVHLDIPGASEGHIADRKNAKLEWESIKSNYCKGAKNPTFSHQHRYDDDQYCKYGFNFEPGDQMNEDIGQGAVTVSPLQLAVAYAALANGGTVYEPRIAKAIVSPTGQLVKKIKPKVQDHLPISQGDLNYIRAAMYGVTDETGGTGQGVFSSFPMSKVHVGGKTGTAELTGTNQNGSWFASFAGPAGGAPQYVTVIEVNKAPQGAEGAAPFVKTMWDDLYGLQGHKAIFPNGVPPKKLPVLGTKAARQAQARAQANSSHHHTPSSTTSTSPGTGKGTSPSSPPSSISAGGLPPALPVSRRREAVG
jgi:penicillin-binding protein 2